MIECKIPPLNVSADDWAALSRPEQALYLAAQECDTYHTQEFPLGSNRGPRVDEFLRVAQSVPGEPWCAAFVCWCIVKIHGAMHVQYPASVVSWVAWAKSNARLRNKPQRAGLGYFDLPGETHIFWIADVNTDGTVSTIEGNTNTGGSREGYEVARRTRSIASITGFIDLTGI